MFYRQVVLREGLPFDVRIPSPTTVTAMRKLDRLGWPKKATVTDRLCAKKAPPERGPSHLNNGFKPSA
jgi:antitoxin component of RelBE/YafQ-DinJ toxin-antitoxin module